MRDLAFVGKELTDPGNPGLEGNLMEFLFWSIVGGLVGTALMDITGGLAEQLKITIRGS